MKKIITIFLLLLIYSCSNANESGEWILKDHYNLCYHYAEDERAAVSNYADIAYFAGDFSTGNDCLMARDLVSVFDDGAIWNCYKKECLGGVLP